MSDTTTSPMEPTPKQASQARLINSIMAACQQATACTTIEVLGALEVVKSDISTRMCLSRMQQGPGLVVPASVTGN